jgi:hypothetical protein
VRGEGVHEADGARELRRVGAGLVQYGEDEPAGVGIYMRAE